MQSAVIVGQQVAIMFLLTLMGVFCCKKGLMTEEMARSLSSFLLNIALPGVLFSSLYRPMKAELLAGFGLALFLGVLMHLFAIGVSKLLIPARGGQAYRAERFSIVYANSAYMAMPLIRATLGEESTFYATAFVSVFMFFHWTHGIVELGGQMQGKKLIKNPCVLAVLLGLVFFLLQIPLPWPVIETIRLLGGLTTPLSMIIAGVFLSNLKLSDLKSLHMYKASLLRTVFLPLCSVGIVWALGSQNWFEGALAASLAAIYCYSCPCGVSVILLSAALGKDETYPGRLVAITTLMSLVTLPTVAALAIWVLA